MGINLGTTNITKVYLGQQEISKVYQGNNLIYPVDTPAENWVNVIPENLTNNDFGFNNFNIRVGDWNNRGKLWTSRDDYITLFANKATTSSIHTYLGSSITLSPGDYRCTIYYIFKPNRNWATSIRLGDSSDSDKYGSIDCPTPEADDDQEFFPVTGYFTLATSAKNFRVTVNIDTAGNDNFAIRRILLEKRES